MRLWRKSSDSIGGGVQNFAQEEEERELSWWVQIGNGGRWGTLTTINHGDGFHLELRQYVKVTHVKTLKKGNEESSYQWCSRQSLATVEEVG